MIVHIGNRKDFAQLIRLFRVLEYPVKIELSDWDIYKEDTCVSIKEEENNEGITTYSISEYSSIKFYKNKYPDKDIINYYFFISNYICIEDLDQIPVDVVIAMIVQQKNASNPPNLSVFQKDLAANQFDGGFNWDLTVQEEDYWEELLINRAFDDFNLIEATRIS